MNKTLIRNNFDKIWEEEKFPIRQNKIKAWNKHAEFCERISDLYEPTHTESNKGTNEKDVERLMQMVQIQTRGLTGGTTHNLVFLQKVITSGNIERAISMHAYLISSPPLLCVYLEKACGILLWTTLGVIFGIASTRIISYIAHHLAF